MFAKCTLKNDSNNAPWAITNGDATLTTGAITIFNEYAQPSTECPLAPSTDLVFPNGIVVTPVLKANSTIEELKVSGTASNGASAFGSVKPETETLGLVTVP